MSRNFGFFLGLLIVLAVISMMVWRSGDVKHLQRNTAVLDKSNRSNSLDGSKPIVNRMHFSDRVLIAKEGIKSREDENIVDLIDTLQLSEIERSKFDKTYRVNGEIYHRFKIKGYSEDEFSNFSKLVSEVKGTTLNALGEEVPWSTQISKQFGLDENRTEYIASVGYDPDDEFLTFSFLGSDDHGDTVSLVSDSFFVSTIVGEGGVWRFSHLIELVEEMENK